jgi:hypothetical protein
MLDLTSEFCNKLYFLRWCHDREDSYCGVCGGQGYQRFLTNILLPSQLCPTDGGSMLLWLLEYAYYHSKIIMWLCYELDRQILCLWYNQAHNTCLSILVLSILQDKSPKRSAVALESLNKRGRREGPGGGGAGEQSEVNDDFRNQECRPNSFNLSCVLTQSSKSQKHTSSCIFPAGADER